MERYFILTNSDQSLSKRFRVLHGGYIPMKMKKGTERTTLDGQWDISQGGLYKRHEYIIRVRETDPEPEFGTKDDLDTFFSYNSPNPPSGPSNRINFIDHYGNEFIVAIPGEFVPQPLTVELLGENAIFTMKVIFIFLETVTAS